MNLHRAVNEHLLQSRGLLPSHRHSGTVVFPQPLAYAGVEAAFQVLWRERGGLLSTHQRQRPVHPGQQQATERAAPCLHVAGGVERLAITAPSSEIHTDQVPVAPRLWKSNTPGHPEASAPAA